MKGKVLLTCLNPLCSCIHYRTKNGKGFCLKHDVYVKPTNCCVDGDFEWDGSDYEGWPELSDKSSPDWLDF